MDCGSQGIANERPIVMIYIYIYIYNKQYVRNDYGGEIEIDGSE